MRKIYLTEKQILDIVRQSFVCEASVSMNGDAIKNLQKNITNRISNIASTNTDLQNSLQGIGVNPNYSDTERNATRRNLGNNFNTTLENEIKNAARILSKYVGNSGLFDKTSDGSSKMKADYPNEYNKLMRIKEFLDSKGLNWVYDINVIPNEKKYFGFSKDDKTIEDRINHFSLSNIGNPKDYIDTKNTEGMFDEEKISLEQNADVKMKASLLDNYLSKTYGLNIELPINVFSHGNAKLPKDTLIVNFSAALQCPAWNECLLREACYARRGEKQHTIVRDANVRRNLMWEAGRYDEELMQMIEQLMRLYSINYSKAIPLIKKQIGKTYTVQKLSKTRFSEFKDERVLNILKECSAIKHIRLNENGDFIGQWLVDAIDKIAGDFMVVGISTSAYTCRNINMDYSKVANIILNVSNQAIQSGNVARYFFAVDEETYNALDETYGGPNNSLVVSAEGVTPNPQPLYKMDETKNVAPTGTMYYKCPCGRNTNEKRDVNCYDCNICYQPNNISDKPYYVVVKVHSKGDKKIVGTHVGKDKIPVFGFSKNYLTNIGIAKWPEQRIDEEATKNDFSTGIKEGLFGAARNCVISLREHLAGLAGE